MSTRTCITADDPDVSFYSVYDGSGEKIWNCTKADTFTGEVTVLVTDPTGKLLTTELLNGDVDVVRVTYRPPGGVKIVDRRGDLPIDVSTMGGPGQYLLPDGTVFKEVTE
jgi:hypothetical protein